MVFLESIIGACITWFKVLLDNSSCEFNAVRNIFTQAAGLQLFDYICTSKFMVVCP